MKAGEGDFWNDRRRALEDSFFAERDRELLARLRGELSQLEDQRKLAHVSGIIDEKVLQDLLASGIRAESLAAVRMIPLVEVAWCDGHVSPEERHAVLRAAAENGIQPDTACYQLLASWLETRPDPQVLNSWKEYVRELTKMMRDDTRRAFRRDLDGRLRKIAQAAGGFLGRGKISQQEQDTIDELTGIGTT
jgi:hypothetical protein